jgi:phenylalanyl-tRNA synthetase beta chain
VKVAYNHLIRHIKEKPSIENISDCLFQLGHEHEIECDIFDMEFTPNRGDCLSVNGLLRDLAVFYTIDLKQDVYDKDINELSMNFENLSETICPNISFLKIEIGNIPQKYNNSLNDYFLDLSLSKNNFFTDVSNYLSYETGQPTHCYDAEKINGKLVFAEIDINNEEFQTLHDKKITLSKKNSVFLLNNEIVSLAGVIGGKSTACSKKTKTVIVECANFQPEAIIGKSIKYDIQSEASHKFERGVDPCCHDKVLRRFISIVNEHANIENISVVSYGNDEKALKKIPINVNKINKIIGIDISEAEYLNYLAKLGFCIEDRQIIIPSYRNDVKTHNDIAEEVARVIGYNNIGLLDINIPRGKKDKSKDIENNLRYFLLDNGFYEIINSPFVDHKSENAIKVDNPLDSNKEFLRTNITNSLLDNLLYNEKRQKDSIKLFEISDIYFSSGVASKQRKLSIIASGRLGLNYEDYSKKIDKKYLEILLKGYLPDKELDIKILSRDLLDTKINSEIVSFEIDLNKFTDSILSYKATTQPPKIFNQYQGISEQPSSFKDISYSIKDFSKVSVLENLLLEYQSDIIKDIYVFDYFINKKKQEIKIGFRFNFQSKHQTLQSDQIEDVLSDIIKESYKINGLDIPGYERS